MAQFHRPSQQLGPQRHLQLQQALQSQQNLERRQSLLHNPMMAEPDTPHHDHTPHPHHDHTSLPHRDHKHQPSHPHTNGLTEEDQQVRNIISVWPKFRKLMFLAMCSKIFFILHPLCFSPVAGSCSETTATGASVKPHPPLNHMIIT